MIDARLYLFDADGTLRRTLVDGQPCPHRDDEWQLIEDVQPMLRQLPVEVLLGVASNQDHVGYGHLTLDDARRLLREMMHRATGRLLPNGAIELCPHRLDETCRCRKPAPAMLERLLAFHRVAPADALFVGDADCDRRAAEAAGVRFVWAQDFFKRR